LAHVAGGHSPAPETVGSRDVIALDLLESPTTGQKIVDYIRIGRNCDASPGADEGSCVKIMLQDARAALDEKLKQLESHDDPATIAAVRSSQRLWEAYRSEACASLLDETKRAQCEVKLLHSRTRELGEIY
jgi:uncharacterized protein YecT (DUF1311 family)